MFFDVLIIAGLFGTSPAITGVIIAVTCWLILIGIFFLCDDRKEIIQLMDSDSWRTLGLALIPMIIYIGFPIYMFVGVWTSGDRLWNPYIFGGMPAYAIGTGYPWWNMINGFVSTTMNVLFYNPIGTALFGISVFRLLKRKTIMAYSLMLFMEILMLYFAYWNLGLRAGFIQ